MRTSNGLLVHRVVILAVLYAAATCAVAVLLWRLWAPLIILPFFDFFIAEWVITELRPWLRGEEPAS